MSNGNWWDPYLAPGIVVGVIIAAFSWVRSYLAGKKSNVKEAKLLETQVVERAEAKDVKEKTDAKLLELEKTTAATMLKKDAKEEAIEVKKESREFMNNRFKFTDQEHAHQHAELLNKIKTLEVKIEQVGIDLQSHMRSQDDINEKNKRDNKALKD